MSCRFPEKFWEKKHVLNPLKVSILSSILFICSYIPNQKQVSMKSAPKPSYLSRRQWLYFKSNSTQQFISKIFRTPTMCKTLRKKKWVLPSRSTQSTESFKAILSHLPTSQAEHRLKAMILKSIECVLWKHREKQFFWLEKRWVLLSI